VKQGSIYRHAISFVATALALVAMVWIAGWLLLPDSDQARKVYTPEEIKAAEEARDVRFDPDDLPVIHQDVDYSEGEQASWYPKGESPILAKLVKEGKLPPVHERVGSEPIVLKGCEGIGKYGGTWLRVSSSPWDVSVIVYRLSGASVLRWSPLGYPIKPHIAKSVEASPDKREFILTLRKGTRWSDGHPLTTDDVMYWWEHEVNDKSVSDAFPNWMKVAGERGNVERLDDLRVKFTFSKPHGLFFENMAGASGPVGSPEHYLRKYHPTLGDEELCKRAIASYKLASRRALYTLVKDFKNPEHPRLWPWVYRKYKTTSPQVFVRNPYFCAVDTQGNQLPYIDRVQFDVQSRKMIALSAANGKVSMQTRYIRYRDYTELMSRREESGIRILQWYPATRSVYLVIPNINRRVDPARPETKWKARLLADKRFRQALSLAIDRRSIIKAEYNNQVEPGQLSPGPESAFHHERLQHAFIQYDPERAEALLDELGLTGRDYEGYRTFPDGSRMVFYLDFCDFTGIGPGQFLVDDWAKVGVRVVLRERSRALFSVEWGAMEYDLHVWAGASDWLPLSSPRYFTEVGWSRWFQMGGFYGSEEAAGMTGPPKDHPIYRAMQLYEKAVQQPTLAQQKETFGKVLDIAAENLWTINISEAPPQLVVVKNGFRNVPDNALYGHIFSTPANAGIETFYFENPNDSPGAIEDTRDAILNVTPRPGADSTAEGQDGVAGIVTAIIKYVVLGILIASVLLVAVRHPYIGRRLLIMVPTLLIISVVSFSIIQLPPGDFLSAKIVELQESGDEAAKERIADLKKLFHYEDPMWKRYLRWMGLRWFITFDRKDQGLLQGNMGRSMETSEEVNSIVGNRIILTVLISLGTILFTWAAAIPIGIFSAVKQYSISDYVLTFIGFVGMCVPPFLLALILMAVSGVSGLFSAEFAAQPEWTWGKVFDLLGHIWIPVVVLGVGGTAGMIRVMRANLLDELKKPYVITAMAKGVRPMKLLLKYPVRMALNPFISGIGGLFPQLVSGGAIVGMVLSLPTVGPLLLQALFSEDMYLAGSMLMVLSLLGVLGTLVSDLLLLWLDPRIRFKGGAR